MLWMYDYGIKSTQKTNLLSPKEEYNEFNNKLYQQEHPNLSTSFCTFKKNYKEKHN